MVSAEKITLSDWNEEADKAISKADGEDVTISKGLVKSGLALLYKWQDGENLGYFTMQTTQRKNGKELVLMSGGIVKGIGLIEYLVSKEFFVLCKTKGYVGIRFFTQKPGVQRMFEKGGFSLYQVIMRKDLVNEP